MLLTHTWTLCTGFRAPNGDLWLNDSLSEDGAQEYAVIRHGRQIESVTVSWCTLAALTAYIDGGLVPFGDESHSARFDARRLDFSAHECGLCA